MGCAGSRSNMQTSKVMMQKADASQSAAAPPTAAPPAEPTLPIRFLLIEDEFGVCLGIREGRTRWFCISVLDTYRDTGDPRFQDLQIRQIIGVGSFWLR